MINWQEALEAFDRVVERKYPSKQHLAGDVAIVRAAIVGAKDLPAIKGHYDDPMHN